MTNPMSWHADEISDCLAGTRLRQSIVLYVTLGGLFTEDGGIAVSLVKEALRISDEMWDREYRRMYDDCLLWSIGNDRVKAGLAHSLAQYALAGISGRPSPKLWAELREMMRDRAFGDSVEPHCKVCGRQDVSLALDHVMPIAKGGSNHPLNLTWLCVPCNSSKGAKTLDEWMGRAQ